MSPRPKRVSAIKALETICKDKKPKSKLNGKVEQKIKKIIPTKSKATTVKKIVETVKPVEKKLPVIKEARIPEESRKRQSESVAEDYIPIYKRRNLVADQLESSKNDDIYEINSSQSSGSDEKGKKKRPVVRKKKPPVRQKKPVKMTLWSNTDVKKANSIIHPHKKLQHQNNVAVVETLLQVIETVQRPRPVSISPNRTNDSCLPSIHFDENSIYDDENIPPKNLTSTPIIVKPTSTLPRSPLKSLDHLALSPLKTSSKIPIPSHLHRMVLENRFQKKIDSSAASSPAKNISPRRAQLSKPHDASDYFGFVDDLDVVNNSDEPINSNSIWTAVDLQKNLEKLKEIKIPKKTKKRPSFTNVMSSTMISTRSSQRRAHVNPEKPKSVAKPPMKQQIPPSFSLFDSSSDHLVFGAGPTKMSAIVESDKATAIKVPCKTYDKKLKSARAQHSDNTLNHQPKPVSPSKRKANEKENMELMSYIEEFNSMVEEVENFEVIID